MNRIFCSTFFLCICLAMLFFLVDFSSKYWIVRNIVLHDIHEIFPFLNLFYVRNYGGIFGFLSNENGWQHYFFSVITIIIIVILIFDMYINRDNPSVDFCYALIIGGAFGNLFDRLYYGYVIDFIDFHVHNWHFATFNIADCCVCIGSICLICEILSSYKNQHS